jgi:serine/threonine protein kinase
MSACNRESGRRLLEGELTPGEESSVIQHLDGCPRCQAWLEQDAGDDAAWSTARQYLATSTELSRWPVTRSDARTVTQLQHARAAEDGVERHPPVDISFLAPSDDPAYLGRLGSYEIAGIVGYGGMGVVLKAVDRSLSRYVAIKVLSPALSGVGAARQRFAREARAMAALSHEHVVPIYAVDEHRGLPYFAMEYVPGGTLQARLSHEGPLEVVAAVRIAIQTALALDAAHDSGLVHRDIKPANILLDRGIERVRVADFGLARTASEAGYTATGVLAGTPQFMSPEQVRGESCDGRSDLFSLGSVMYAMCTGHEPFRAESVYSVLQRIVNDEPRTIREQNPGVPEWLEAFIGKLMAKDREERFQSAAEVAEVLERELAHLQNPSISAAPLRTWMPRKTRLTASRPTAFSRRAAYAAALCAALLATVSIWRPWQSGDANDQGGGISGASAKADADSSLATLQPPTVPLWGADGAADVAAFGVQLEADLFDFPASPPSDPWPGEVAAIRGKLAELADEFSVSSESKE